MIGPDGNQVGVMSSQEAVALAKRYGVDLVEIAATAKPPVCRIVDYGKYQYEQSKKQKEQKKHQHSNKLKEVQLSPVIDPHDYGYKLDRAKQFLSEDMKVKVSLRFKGRQMAHTEVGFEVVKNFIKDIETFAQPDSKPKLVGRAINFVLSPLPKNKRAKYEGKGEKPQDDADSEGLDHDASEGKDNQEPHKEEEAPRKKPVKQGSARDFTNSVLEDIDL